MTKIYKGVSVHITVSPCDIKYWRITFSNMEDIIEMPKASCSLDKAISVACDEIDDHINYLEGRCYA